MERTYIKDVTPGMRRVSGFVENFRNKRTMAFIVVKDITGKLQVTIEKEKHPEFEEALRPKQKKAKKHKKKDTEENDTSTEE